jgi:hypothetical protein
VTQPTLNRRGFIAAISAAVLAGPRALASLLDQHRRSAVMFSIDFPYQVVWRARPATVIWSREVQADFEKMLAYEAKEWHHFDRINPRARSGFRAWSQRHPS